MNLSNKILMPLIGIMAIFTIIVGSIVYTSQMSMIQNIQQNNETSFIKDLENSKKSQEKVNKQFLELLSKMIAKSVSSLVYNMDQDNMEKSIVEFMNIESIKGIYVFDKADNAYFFGMELENSILVQKKIPSESIKKIELLKEELKVKKEIIGFLEIYYDNKQIEEQVKLHEKLKLQEFTLYNTQVIDHANSAFLKQMIIFIGGILMVFFIIRYILQKTVLNPIKILSSGLNDFFSFLKKEVHTSKPINITSKDEFGEITSVINSNISTIQEGIDEDTKLLANITDVAEKIKEGSLSNRVEVSTSNELLIKLKQVLNDMLDNMQNLIGKDINSLNTLLDTYANYDFTAKIDISGQLEEKTMKLGNMITLMLKENYEIGINLDETADKLFSSVSTISESSTYQAASLEEISAAIDQITSTISNTAQQATQMSNISSQTKKSSDHGSILSSKTAESMDKINEQVNNISEAITVIDQIAFQTNILSLNAAVEAATAGEAGKGFAVVAQEVRNLATRSAQAAKEIKDIVEKALEFTRNGKEVSEELSIGFKELSTKINKTTLLVEDVSTSVNEQRTGINLINDSVNSLDAITQKNAAVANETNVIAQETKNISVSILDFVKSKKFDAESIKK